MSVTATHEVLFASFFFQEKGSGQRKFQEGSEDKVPLQVLSATFPPNTLGKLNFILSKNLGDGYTHFLLKKKVGKENFRRALRQKFLSRYSQRLFHPILLETSTLFSPKTSVMATPKVLFASFFFQEKGSLFAYFFFSRKSRSGKSTTENQFCCLYHLYNGFQFLVVTIRKNLIEFLV